MRRGITVLYLSLGVAAILAEQAEIGRRVADAQHPLRPRVAPARADTAADEAAGYDAELLSVEIAQVDDVHGYKIARIVPLFRPLLRRGYPCCFIIHEGG